MKDPLPRSYDEWRTRSREDQEEIDEQRRFRDEREMDRADEMRDRERDEPREQVGFPDEAYEL